MFCTKIVKILVILILFSTEGIGQSNYFANNFVPYRMIDPVDSVLTQFLDSLNNDALEGLSIDIITNLCREEMIIYSIWLSYFPDMKTDTIHYATYLSRNTNHFYLSNNKKYKIPITFGRLDDIFKYDYKKYPLLTTDTPRQIFAIIRVNLYNEIEDTTFKAPPWALKNAYQDK